MRFRSVCVLVVVVGVTVSAGIAAAQAPHRRHMPAPETLHGNLAQLMRGVFFINANVVFSAQTENPAAITPADFPSTSPNVLTSTYGGWEAIENAALALADSANLLTIPGRLCANDREAPVRNEDWGRFVQGLKDAGMASYRAAQSRDQERVSESTIALTEACSNCHDVYRQDDVTKRCQP